MHRNSLGDGYGGELVRELFSVSGGGGVAKGTVSSYGNYYLCSRVKSDIFMGTCCFGNI